MALQEVAFPIAFTGGVDTRDDPRTMPATKLLALENAVFTRRSAISKRNGYEGLAKTLDSGGTYSVPRALAARGDELCLFADRSMFSYRTSSGTWSRVGPAESVTHREDPIAATGTDQSMPDIATHEGVSLVAWEDSRGGVWWSVVELASGRILRAAEQGNAAWTRPRCVHVGDRLHLYAMDAPKARIWVIVVNPSDYLATVTPLVVTADVSPTNPSYDAERPAGSAFAVAAMAWAHASGSYRVAYVGADGVITSTPSAPQLESDVVTGPVAIATSVPGNFVGVAWVNAFVLMSS